MNLINLVFKPKLRSFFGYETLHKVIFEADTLKDTLDLTGIGIYANQSEPTVRQGKTMSLVENSNYLDMFTAKINDQLKPKEIHFIKYEIDFIAEKTYIEVKYIDQNGKPKFNNRLGGSI